MYSQNDMMKILAIGNSFSRDALYYLNRIGNADGVAIKAVNLYIPGCSLQRHRDNLRDDRPVYLYEENGDVTQKKISIRQALLSDQWDYVVTQQSSAESGRAESYFPYLEEIAAGVRQYAPSAEFLLHQTWAYEKDYQDHAFAVYQYDQSEMFRKLSDAYRDAADRLGIRLIPGGEVIQQVRQTPPFLFEKGGRSLCRDGRHMDYLYGRYLLGAVWYRFLTGNPVSGNAFIPERDPLSGESCDVRLLHRIQRMVDETVQTEDADGNADDDMSAIRSVNHRGYSVLAPENTLPAYRLSKKMGFRYVEADVSFTSDGVPVLLHDATIDRTSDGKGKLSEMTFQQVRRYDFGLWKSPEYRGTKIPALTEFLSLCRTLGLYPYIELKPNGDYTREQIRSIVEMVKEYGLQDRAAYISFSPEYLGIVRDCQPSARLGFLSSRASARDLEVCRRLKTTEDSVFYDVKHTTLTKEICGLFADAGIPVEVWTVNRPEIILNLYAYVRGITSDSQIAGKVLSGQGINPVTLKKKATGLRRVREMLKKVFLRMAGTKKR